jgi:hypothetical protein
VTASALHLGAHQAGDVEIVWEGQARCHVTASASHLGAHHAPLTPGELQNVVSSPRSC